MTLLLPTYSSLCVLNSYKITSSFLKFMTFRTAPKGLSNDISRFCFDKENTDTTDPHTIFVQSVVQNSQHIKSIMCKQKKY